MKKTMWVCFFVHGRTWTEQYDNRGSFKEWQDAIDRSSLNRRHSLRRRTRSTVLCRVATAVRWHETSWHGISPRYSRGRQWFVLTQGGVLVLDDLMDKGSNDKRVLSLFSRESHHRNITVLYLCQDLGFHRGNFPRPFRVMRIT